MSEYLSKKAVLEWLDDRRYKSPWIESFRERLESGAFDAPEMEHINTYWAREGLIKHQKAEIQRLRAALESIASIKYEALGYSPEDAECMNRIAVEALSATTEPTGAQRVGITKTDEGRVIITSSGFKKVTGEKQKLIERAFEEAFEEGEENDA